MHNLINIEDLSLSFPNKICFENFCTQISFGDRIAIIGRNGRGKTSLLKMIKNLMQRETIGYVPQIISDFEFCSGGEKFNKALSRELGLNPSVLLLDEPTNHLDLRNRQSLMRMLKSYYGTLIIVTHDKEILKIMDILWHIENGKINIFHGKYDDYLRKLQIEREALEKEMRRLSQQKKSTHESLIMEQERVSKSKSAGKKKIKNKKWMKSVGGIKAMQAEKSQGNKLQAIDEKKQAIADRLSNLRLPETIVPKFHVPFRGGGEKMLVFIENGSVGYGAKTILKNINLSLMSNEKIAVVGDNGSGKTTIAKAILNDEKVIKTGTWHAPNAKDIGYLEQHYNNLNVKKSALEIIADAQPTWCHAEIRRHLADFLFRKNEEVNSQAFLLSGGEKARLCLAKIAANPPELLILDEITNNIDLETRNHVVEILQNYPGAMLVISHDKYFLDEIGIKQRLLL